MVNLFAKYHAEFKERVKGKPPGRYAFRGQANEGWRLESAARTRLRINSKEFLLSYNEAQLIEPARRNGWGREAGRRLHDLEVLARLQHYGAATCLLDFTRSFHVALWFACQKEDVNGRVFIIDTNDRILFKPIKEKDLSSELHHFLYDDKVWHWDLESLTERIARQDSVFILGEYNLFKEGQLPQSIIINHKDKKDLLKEMEDLFNLRSASLFKDIFGFASINRRNDRPLADEANDFFISGRKLYERDDFKKAIEQFSKAIKRNPDFIAAYNNRGFSKKNLGKYREAFADFDKVVELRPNGEVAYNNRGVCRYKIGQNQMAIADFNEAIRLKPDYAKAYNNRGIAYQELGEGEKAQADFDTAKKLGFKQSPPAS